MRFIHVYFFVASLCLASLETQTMNLNYRKVSTRYQNTQSRPNILFLMVDQLRKPVVYENDALRTWQRENLTTMTFLQDNGVNFDNHYCSTTACAPSRATIFTGQYPTLHGVSQTNGAAKSATDSTMFWLSPNTVPTAGNIFTEGNYATFYIGKWHLSNEDLYNPGTKTAVLSYDINTGIPNIYLENIYRSANMLSSYGFNNQWIGPEPHGTNPHNSGGSAAIGVSGRDIFYADKTIELLDQLNAQGPSAQPWFVVCSFVNPHDISLYGELSKYLPTYNFDTDPSLPAIAPAPTAEEDLSTKPIAQESYKEQYQLAMQPTFDTEDYRKLYYTLQKKVDVEMGRVLATLLGTRFKNNTIVIFTSDHGELLGAHSNFQKWFNMYEESIHVPLTFYSPTLLPQGINIDLLTSHVDVLPTLCGFAGINVDAITTGLQTTYTDSRTLVGRDLSSIVLGTASSSEIDAFREPILFQTFDQIFTGQYSTNPIGTPHSYVTQPAFVDAVLTELNGEIWKLARYYQNTSFANPLTCTCSTPVQPASPSTQYEMYNLADDPLETRNLADAAYSTQETVIIQNNLIVILDAQITQKDLLPVNQQAFVPTIPPPS